MPFASLLTIALGLCLVVWGIWRLGRDIAEKERRIIRDVWGKTEEEERTITQEEMTERLMRHATAPDEPFRGIGR